MRWKATLTAIVFASAAAALAAQETKTTTQQTTEQKNPDGSVQTTTKTTTVSGSVVQYTPGQTIVIRSSDGRTTTYSIGSAVQVPAEVQIGKTVTLSTAPASDGSGIAMVTNIQTTTVNSQGQTKTTTERTETAPSGQTTKSTTTTVYGTVTAYEPGHSITIEQPSHQSATYTIDTESQLPQDIAVGKSVTIRTTTSASSTSPIVRRVTYRTVTKTTRSKTVNPQ